MLDGIYNSNKILKKYENLFKASGVEIDFYDFLDKNSYEIIKDSELFDIDFYFENYPDVDKLNLNPISHYLKFGTYESCFPNPTFDTNKYIKLNENNLNGLNPLVHYITYGGGNIIHECINEINKNLFSKEIYKNIFNAIEKEITLIIPIYNAYEDTKKCIESIFDNTTVKFKLILIDDKSTDSRISYLLDEYEKYSNVKVIRNEINKGFTKNVNIGLNQSENDVILVNSDTMVTPRWVQKIIINAYSEDNIGTLTPISNASDISVPNMHENNEIPSFLNLYSMSLLVEKSSVNGNLIAPTGNGFCLFIKRKTINDVGLFDEKNFDRGYGEESDFTMRAKNNGWKNVRNDSIFIYHKRSASFSLNKTKELKKEHKQTLLKKHPTVFEEWDKFVNSEKLSKSIESIQNNIKNFNINLIKQNILCITSMKNDKPNFKNDDLLTQKYNIFILTIKESEFGLWVIYNNKYLLIDKVSIDLNSLNYDDINYNYLLLYKTFNFDYILMQDNATFRILKEYPNLDPNYFASKLRIPILRLI